MKYVKFIPLLQWLVIKFVRDRQKFMSFLPWQAAQFRCVIAGSMFPFLLNALYHMNTHCSTSKRFSPVLNHTITTLNQYFVPWCMEGCGLPEIFQNIPTISWNTTTHLWKTYFFRNTIFWPSICMFSGRALYNYLLHIYRWRWCVSPFHKRSDKTELFVYQFWCLIRGFCVQWTSA
jgi:hypothetical protein